LPLTKDATNKSNPLVRALAIRTMGCLRVKSLCTYLKEPLNNALGDSDAYVRKNAVLCVPKVYEIEPNLIEENQMINKLKKILETDKNSIVLANTIIALSEINMLRPVKVRILTKNNLENVLVALNESVGMLGSSRVGAGLHT
jgi:vesicle coat complex subunit